LARIDLISTFIFHYILSSILLLTLTLLFQAVGFSLLAVGFWRLARFNLSSLFIFLMLNVLMTLAHTHASFNMAIGFWLLAVGGWLLAVGCWLVLT